MLGISADEQDREVIEAAVIRQSAYVRNFQSGPNAEHATKLLNEIAAARGCLLDAQKRAAYDATIRPAMGTVIQIPQGTLPIGTAIASTPLGTQANPLGTQAAASKAAAGPAAAVSPTTSGSPAGASSLQPIVVRPASWIDTLPTAGMDVTKINLGAAAGARPTTAARGPKAQNPGSKPQSISADELKAPSESLFDQLLAADVTAPAIRRQPTKAQPPRTVILAACGGLAGLLVIIGLATLFGSSASTDDHSRPADPLSKPAIAVKKKEPPRTSQPRRKPADSHPGAESLDLSLDQPAPMPGSRPAHPVSPNPTDGISNPSAAVLGPGNDVLPGQSGPNDPPGGMVAGNGAGPFTDQVPPLNSGFPPAPGNNNVIAPTEMAAQPGQFQPRLKLNEDRPYGEIRRLELMSTHCSVLAFSASGRQLAAGMSNGRVLLWSMEDPQDFKSLNNFGESRIPVTCLAFTPDDKSLMVGTSDGRIRGISLQGQDQPEITQFSEHLAGPRRIVFFRDGAGVISSGDDRTVRIWTLADGKQLNFFGGFRTSVTCLWADETGNRIRASDSRIVGLVNLDSDKPPRNFNLSPRATAKATMSHDGRYLVWPNGRGLVVRDLTNAREDTPFPDDKTRRAGESRFSPDDRLLAMANSSDPSITLWDFKDRKKLAELAAHSMPLSDVAFSPDNRLLASGSLDTSLRIWRLPDQDTLRKDARKIKTDPAE